MATLIQPKELLGMYAAGWFPMAAPDGDIRLFSPDPRGILPLENFRIPHGARKEIADAAWEMRVDTAFEEVLAGCASRKETWIDECIAGSYMALHWRGFAHSVEIWRNGSLAGGLYGVNLGGAFFGESMFHRVPGASKVALAGLVYLLKTQNFELLDIQWVTDHLKLFGAREVSRRQYLSSLRNAVRKECQWTARGDIPLPPGWVSAISGAPGSQSNNSL